MIAEQPVDLLLKGYRAFLAGDLGAIEGMLDPNLEWLGIEQTWDGAPRDDVLEVLAERLREGYRLELDRCIGAGDKVVVSMRFAGSEPGDPEQYYAVGRYAAVVTFREGRVARVEEYPHFASALQAVGLPAETG
jgi:ketosteroid isomerase-like protein